MLARLHSNDPSSGPKENALQSTKTFLFHSLFDPFGIFYIYFWFTNTVARFKKIKNNKHEKF